MTTVAVLAFLALVAWSMRGAQAAECSACVEFGGRRNCATASAASQREAAQAAQSTACGVLAGGMNEAIACDRTTPATLQCRMN